MYWFLIWYYLSLLFLNPYNKTIELEYFERRAVYFEKGLIIECLVEGLNSTISKKGDDFQNLKVWIEAKA